MEPRNDHLVITPPDRYFGEGHRMLWVDWEWSQIEQSINALRGSPEKLVIGVFGPGDTDLKWLLDTAYQSSIIIMNMSLATAADPIKGNLLSLDRTYYYGRKDLEDIFPGYIEDPLGRALAWIGEISERGNNEPRRQ